MITDEELKKSELEGDGQCVIPPDMSPNDQRTLRLALHLSWAIYHDREFGDCGLDTSWQALVDHIRLAGRPDLENRVIVASARIQQANVVGKTNREYPLGVLQEIADRHNRRPIQGYHGSPTGEWIRANGGPTINVVSYISHEVRNLRMEGSWLVGDVVLMANVHGLAIKALMDEGKLFNWALRSMAYTKHREPDGVQVVTSCEVIGIDAVQVTET